ncbi:MAG: hypothetical protein KAJ19_26885, partial [Gammaproteobacteria bacterium]|nr:hypothetical protein [Gammaproteobacteria bacterium]
MSNLPFPFNGTEAIAEAPIDQDLMDNKYRKNIEFLCDEIDNISGGGGGGGVAVNARPEVGLISQGGETNEAIYWKKRFHVNEHMRTQDPNNISGFNPKGDEVGNELLVFMQTNDDNWGFSADPNSYLGETMIIQKD